MMIILTFFVAIIGAFGAIRLKWPAAPMIGALVSVSLFNVITDAAFIPGEFKVLTQMIAGVFIGSRIHKQDLQQLKKMIIPVVIALLSLISICLIMGYGIHLLSGENLATGLLASAPGGLVDITLMSEDLGADSAVVSVFQITRLFSVLALFPVVLKTFMKKRQSDSIIKEEEEVSVSQEKEDRLNIWITLGVAFMSGLLGKMSQIPAGILIFSMVGCSFLNIFFNRIYMPKWIRSGAQICAGSLIGSSVTLAAILDLKTCLIPALLMVMGYLLLDVGLAFLLNQFTQIDFTTAFFACAPGGASDMTLMSGDFGANIAWVSVFQIIRSISIIAIYPFIVLLFTT